MENINLLKENKNISNYYYYPKIFSDEEIDNILEISKKYKSDDGLVNMNVDYNYRKSKIKWIPYNDETKFLYDKIIELMKEANSKMWNFNITNILNKIQLSEYNDGSIDEIPGHYDWHMDFGETVSTRKLSMSIQLSDETEYEGGDLEFMIHRSILQAPKTKGTVIFFPSYITHRVSNITKGVRRSLVCWFNGPPYV